MRTNRSTTPQSLASVGSTGGTSPASAPSSPPAQDLTDLERLGARFRSAREARDLSVSDLAPRCKLRSQELSAIEEGQEEPYRSVVARLDAELDAKGVLVEAWARVHISGLVERGADLEEARRQAHRVCGYAPLGIPRLFQDYAYATAVEKSTPGLRFTPPLTVQSDAAGPPYFTLLLDETALTRPVGEPKALRRQLDKLLTYAESKATAVHVIPAHTPHHPGLHGGLWTLTYSAHHTIAYQPAADGTGHLITDTAAITRYTDAMTTLLLAALPAEASTRMIRQARADLEDGPKAIEAGADMTDLRTTADTTPAQTGSLAATRR